MSTPNQGGNAPKKDPIIIGLPHAEFALVTMLLMTGTDRKKVEALVLAKMLDKAAGVKPGESMPEDKLHELSAKLGLDEASLVKLYKLADGVREELAADIKFALD